MDATMHDAPTLVNALMQRECIAPMWDSAPMDQRVEIAQWMQAVMDASGWSAKRWADEAGTYGSNITRLIKNPMGSAHPKQDTLAKLVRALPSKAASITLPAACRAAAGSVFDTPSGNIPPQDETREVVARINPAIIQALTEMNNPLYWQAEKEVIDFLRSVGISDERMIRGATAMYYHKLASGGG